MLFPVQEVSAPDAESGTPALPASDTAVLALGLRTMIGWKRIVVTAGEKIGKDHLTYAQRAAAEIAAMTTV